jgi:hypothetical protein
MGKNPRTLTSRVDGVRMILGPLTPYSVDTSPQALWTARHWAFNTAHGASTLPERNLR